MGNKAAARKRWKTKKRKPPQKRLKRTNGSPQQILTESLNVTISNIRRPGLRDRRYSALPPSPTLSANEGATGEDVAGFSAEADGSKSSGHSSMTPSEIDPDPVEVNSPKPRILKAKQKSRKQQPPSKRYRPPSNALQEIRKYQCSTELLIPKLPIQRLIREITYRKTGNNEFKYQGAAIAAIHAAAEAFVVGLMENSYLDLAFIHAKRVTLMQKDTTLALRIRGNPHYFNSI